MHIPAITRFLQYLALSAYLAFLVAPMLWLISTAFKGPQELMTIGQSWIPRLPTAENFMLAWAEQPLVQATVNSILISGGSALLSIVLSIPAAYVIARYRGAASTAAMIWVLLSQMFPFILVIIPLFLVMINIGLYDTRWGLVLVYVVFTLPFSLWMLRSYVNAIPRELEEAAAIDGASRLRTLTNIVAPLLWPGMAATAMFSFINSWNDFFFALVMLREPNAATLSLTLVRFIGNDGNIRVGPLAAAAVLATIPSLLFFLLIQRKLVGGLLNGAVKG